MTRKFRIGAVPIGGGSPVTVQSMTNTDTHNAMETLTQINALHMAGADIVRVSVYDDACLPAFGMICARSPVPIVADIHYRADLAVGALEQGAAKVRINPGNIGSAAKVRLVADCAKDHGAPIRIGVNSGSIERDILRKYGGVTAEGMVESALSHAALLEKAGFTDIVLSLKASDVPMTVQANRLVAAACDYPLHLGVTEAGLPGEGHVKSAVGIGALLLDGIGDTIRVSLSGDSRAGGGGGHFHFEGLRAAQNGREHRILPLPAGAQASTWPASPPACRRRLPIVSCRLPWP